ncbi:hypothetical protein Acsp02_38870 [Actinoplanes sp. NBRC 103695]|nr:hypothetical protein Acsp02_38870 [Actinoplanes sp. NBRC 103695]
MVAVAAAAGYGKTTELRDRYPDARWHRGLPSGAGPVASLLAGIALEEARAGARRVVFDDLPSLPPGTAGAVAKLVEGTAEVALASRWPGAHADVGPSALALTVTEVAALLSVDGLDDAANRVHADTAGWPVLAHLAAATLRESGVPHGSLLPVLAQPDGPIAAYLAEEVLPSLPDPARRLLAHLGDLAPVGTALCVTLGHDPSALRHLVRCGLLTTAGSPPVVPGGPAPWLRVVPVVAAVVAGPGPSAAVFYDKHGPPVAAAREYLREGDFSSCARVLSQHGESMVAAGQAAGVTELVSALPSRSAGLWLLLGDARRAEGALDAAAQAYAASGVPASSPALAWRAGRIHYQRGDAPGALAAFAAAEPDLLSGAQGLSAAVPEFSSAADGVQLAAWRANARLLAGAADAALADARRAIALASGLWTTDRNRPGRGLDSCPPGDGVGEVAAGFEIVECDAQRVTAALAVAHVSAALCLAAVGDDAGSEEHYGLALPAAERSGDVVLLTRIHINRTYRLLTAARFDAALVSGRTCAKYAAASGQPSLQAIAACNEGDALAMLGRFDEAVRCYEIAIAGYHRTGSRRVAGAQLGLGEVYRRRGWRQQARAAFEEAIRVATEAGNPRVLGPARNGLALVLLGDEPERAAAIVAPGSLAEGWVALRDGDHDRAAAVAGACCDAARDEGDRVGLADALELRGMALCAGPSTTAETTSGAARVRNAKEKAAVEAKAGSARKVKRGEEGRVALRECHGIWVEAGAVVEAARLEVVLARLPGAGPEERLRGLVAAERLRDAGAGGAEQGEAGAEVVVRAFGRFEVLVGGEVVPASRWQSKKARDLLRILVARRGRPIPRDELCELLWPSDEPADNPADGPGDKRGDGRGKAGHRLSVLLSILRGVLDPAKALPPDHYLVADLASVALDVTRLRVDVEDFLAYVAQARRLVEAGDTAAARALLATIDRHQGGEAAFEDEPYALWSAGLREEARAAHLRMLRMSVQVADNVDAAAGLLLRVLEQDPYDEAAHRGLVRRLVRAGRHGEARRAFERYAEAMRSIGVRPPDPALLSGTSRSAPPPR